MKKLCDIFHVGYGNKFDLNKMSVGSINFVGRSEYNNGVTAKVAPFGEKLPYKKGLITVALGGSVLSSFLQTENFYTGQNVAVLMPKIDLSQSEKIYYCAVIKSNAYRFTACGREANRFLSDLLLPDEGEIPKWVSKTGVELPPETDSPVISEQTPPIDTGKWKGFMLADWFNMSAGKYISKFDYEYGATPYVSASDNNNGEMCRINLPPQFMGNSLTIGKVAVTTFYQPSDFCATSDVTILRPLFSFNKYIGLFLATLINKEKFKWCYGRQIRLNDCKKLIIKLPVKNDGLPDWDFMENYIKSLPYSSQI